MSWAGLDEVAVHGIRGTGHHGVLPEERRDGQEFRVDVVLGLDTRAAAADDDLAATVDYAAVAVGVLARIEGEPVDLIETLAARIAADVLAHDRVRAVRVVVHKPSAPIPLPFDDVTVTLERYR